MGVHGPEVALSNSLVVWLEVLQTLPCFGAWADHFWETRFASIENPCEQMAKTIVKRTIRTSVVKKKSKEIVGTSRLWERCQWQMMPRIKSQFSPHPAESKCL